MIRVVHSGSRIWILTFLLIPDPGSRGHKGNGSRIRIRITIRNQSTNSVELMPGVLKSLKIRAQAHSPFKRMYSEEPSLRRLKCTEVETGQRR
jgi:hypothetical protein